MKKIKYIIVLIKDTYPKSASVNLKYIGPLWHKMVNATSSAFFLINPKDFFDIDWFEYFFVERNENQSIITSLDLNVVNADGSIVIKNLWSSTNIDNWFFKLFYKPDIQCLKEDVQPNIVGPKVFSYLHEFLLNIVESSKLDVTRVVSDIDLFFLTDNEWTFPKSLIAVEVTPLFWPILQYMEHHSTLNETFSFNLYRAPIIFITYDWIHCLILCVGFFIISLISFLKNHKDILRLLISLELLLLSVALTFALTSAYSFEVKGYLITMFLLTAAACESVVGLGLIINLFRKLKACVWYFLSKTRR